MTNLCSITYTNKFTGSLVILIWQTLLLDFWIKLKPQKGNNILAEPCPNFYVSALKIKI